MPKENSVIDWENFGSLLSASRHDNGFARAQALCDAVQEKTGMVISERTIYAIEKAQRAPSADIFLALQQVLSELQDPEYLKPVFRNSNIKVTVVSLE